MIKTVLFLSLVLMLTLHSASAVRQNGPKPLNLTDCQPARIPEPAKCGTFEVYENRATKKGRKIGINILLLPATGDKREPDPLVYFAGGPGSAATEDAIGFAPEFAKIREHRDLLFVDQRSLVLVPPLLATTTPSLSIGDVTRCAQRRAYRQRHS